MLKLQSTEVISSDYLFLQKKLHKSELYGDTSICFKTIIREILEINSCDATCNHGARKTITDVRNAQLIQKSSSWWLLKPFKYFEILRLDNHDFNNFRFWFFLSLKPIQTRNVL